MENNVTIIDIVEGRERFRPELQKEGPTEVLELLEILQINQPTPPPPVEPGHKKV